MKIKVTCMTKGKLLLFVLFVHFNLSAQITFSPDTIIGYFNRVKQICEENHGKL